MTFPALFDLVAGPLLDKRLLAQGIRVASMRRVAVAFVGAATVVRILADPELTTVHLGLAVVVVLGLDAQSAVMSAPKAVFEMIGQIAGAGAGAVRSAWYAGRGVRLDSPPAPPAHEPPPKDEIG